LHIEDSIGRAASIAEFDFQRERPAQLKYPVVTDTGLNGDLGSGWERCQDCQQE
jgi:hypothetical protein